MLAEAMTLPQLGATLLCVAIILVVIVVAARRGWL